MPGEQINLSSEPPGDDRAADRGESVSSRPYVGVQFDCCGVYMRVYINRDGTAYEGRCPRCTRPVRLVIGPGGTDARFFVAR